MFKNILVPLDGSANAEKIAGWSEGLARAFSARLTLLMVVEPTKVIRSHAEHGRDRPERDAHPQDQAPGTDDASIGAMFDSGAFARRDSEPGESPSGYGTQFIERAAQLSNEYLDDVANRLSSRGFEVRSMVTIGSPEDEILRVVEEENIDLITMATHRESTLARGILGSVTDRVIHTSSRPIVAIRPESITETEVMTPNTIVVPLDGSEISESVVPMVSQMAKELNAELVFTRATSLPVHSAMADSGIYYSSPISYYRAMDMAKEYLEPFVAKAKKAGLAATMRAPSGSAANCLISIAEENDRTMIVMATRGESGLKRFIVGSVTDKVIRGSGQPVLVVPPIT